MNAATTTCWSEANQRYLIAAVELVRSTLEQHTRRAKGEAENSDNAAEQALREAADALLLLFNPAAPTGRR